MFFGLPKKEIVKIFKNKFKPINLYRLIYLYNFENIWEKNNIMVKKSFFKSWKIINILSKFGKSINKILLIVFLDYMFIINIILKSSELLLAFILFYYQIITFI